MALLTRRVNSVFFGVACLTLVLVGLQAQRMALAASTVMDRYINEPYPAITPQRVAPATPGEEVARQSSSGTDELDRLHRAYSPY